MEQLKKPHLAESFRKVIEKITKSQCCWCESTNGWYHSYDKNQITARKLEIQSEILRLNQPH